MKIPEFQVTASKTPCTGFNLPLFPNGLSWDEINAILTAHDFQYTYIIERDENKKYIKDYRVGSLKEGSTPKEMFDELRGAVSKGWTIKAENVEFWNRDLLLRALDLHPRYKPTLHLYVGQEGGTSFGMHTDPDPVVVTCVQGEKTFNLEGYDPIVLTPSRWLYIPPNHPHEAISNTISAIVSIGFHKWTDETPSYYLPNLSK
jgi:hypothetical protein